MTVSEATTVPFPVIDLSAWRAGDEASRDTVTAMVDQALRTSGFLLITGHGIDEQIVADARAASLEVFALPAETKTKYEQREGIGSPGWIPLGVEATGYSFGQPTPPDLKESWSVSPVTEPEYVISSHGLTPSRNAFPDEVPAFATAIERYLDGGRVLIGELFELLEHAAEVPPDTFLSQCRVPLHTLNVTWYPPIGEVEPAPEQYRIGPHCDFGTITILSRDESDPPLQVEMPDGEWVDVPHVPGAFVINVGDLLTHWSGGRWRSNPHRIMAPTGDARFEGRLSLVLFVETDIGAVLRPIDDPDGEPLDAVEHLREQLAAIDLEID
ncbi:MAG: 2-oxoglutarate and iron-dependent oxygenase domain-containing protein [Actinomycetota bacterium]